MSLVSIPWNPSRKDLRIFAALQVLFFAFIAWSVWRRTGSTTIAGWIVAISVVVGIVGVIAPAAIRWIYVGWMIAVFPIGWVVSHTIIAAVYYLVITPIGLIMRMSGRDPMDRRFDPAAKTYWQVRPPTPDNARYFRQF